MKFDGILFGNGLSINVINQIKPYIPNDKKYLISVDSFIHALIKDEIPIIRDKIISVMDYVHGSKTDFELIKKSFQEYYDEDENEYGIEYSMGKKLFTGDFVLEKSIFILFYNIWYNYFEEFLREFCDVQLRNFYSSVRSIIKNPNNIWTTNFDRLADSISPQHIHGSFSPNIKQIMDIIFKFYSDEQFYYKTVWGMNGIGKGSLISTLKSYKDHWKYFHLGFFYQNPYKKMDNLLVYGISFRDAGYMEQFDNSQRGAPKPGGIIDEHILIRIKALQSKGQLCRPYFSFYGAEEKAHLIALCKVFEIVDPVFVPASDFPFSIV